MKNELQTKLGQKIRYLRLKTELSQSKLAEKLGIATNTLSNIERGNAFMTSATLERISAIFNISYDELFNFGENFEKSDYVYENILSRLNLIKDNPQKLCVFDTLTKLLI